MKQIWKNAKNALTNIIYGSVALVAIAIPIVAVILSMIALYGATIPEAFSVAVIVALLVMTCWVIGSWIRGEI